MLPYTKMALTGRIPCLSARGNLGMQLGQRIPHFDNLLICITVEDFIKMHYQITGFRRKRGAG